jgi:hypothetical protein
MHKTKGERIITKFIYGKIFKSTLLKAATPAIADSGLSSAIVFPFKDEVLSEHEFLLSSSIEIQTPISAQLDS